MLLTAISPLMAQAGRLRIRVTDSSGAVIPEAHAALLGPDDEPLQTALANDSGEILLTGLPFGDCRFLITAQGFDRRPLTVTLRNVDEVKIARWTSVFSGKSCLGNQPNVDGGGRFPPENQSSGYLAFALAAESE